MKRYSRVTLCITTLSLYTGQQDLMVTGLLRPTILSTSLCRHHCINFSILESTCMRALALASNKKAKHDVDEPMATISRSTGSTRSRKVKNNKRNMHAENDDEESFRLVDGNTEQSPTSRQLVARVRLLHTRHAGVTNVYNIPADRDEQWNFFYQMLQTVENMPSTDVRQSILRSWCAEQRKSYMKTLGVLDLGVRSNWGTEYLTREQKQRLDVAEFDWGHLKHVGKDELVFSNKFQATVREMYEGDALTQGYQAIAKRNAKLYMEHGVTDIPIIKGNTTAQKRIISEMLSDSTLKSSRRYNLDGNEISPNSKGESSVKKKVIPWSQRIKDLKIFVEEHGHCDVPPDFDKDGSLGKWVKRQKNNKKLSLRNQTVLEDLGFKFNYK